MARADVERIIRETAGTYKFTDPDLLIAVGHQESGLDPMLPGDYENGVPQSWGVFHEHSRGRGAGLSPEQRQDVAAATKRAIDEFTRYNKPGQTRGQWAASAQRPANPAAYARAIDAWLGGNAGKAAPADPGFHRPVDLTADDPQWFREYVSQQGAQAPRTAQPAVDDADPAWFKDALRMGAVASSGGQAAPLEGGRGGAVWPVVGQKPGAVNNPFGAGQARAAGTTVQLPSSNVGADLTARHGDTVVAPVSGTVVEVFDAPNERDRNLNHGWGGMTLLQGDDGFQYRLSHAQPGSIGTRPGQRVQAGQYLQRVGVSGNTTGPHLDLEKFSAPGRFVDPVSTSGAVSSPSRGAEVPLTAEPGDPQWFREYVAQQGRR